MYRTSFAAAICLTLAALGIGACDADTDSETDAESDFEASDSSDASDASDKEEAGWKDGGITGADDWLPLNACTSNAGCPSTHACVMYNPGVEPGTCRPKCWTGNACPYPQTCAVRGFTSWQTCL